MKAASLPEIKKELQRKSPKELLELCLVLARFKLENKELLTYSLFEKDYEDGYRENVKSYITDQMLAIETMNVYYAKKSVRKILRQIKKFIRYSKNKETEAVVLMHFCEELSEHSINYKRSRVLVNMFEKQREMAKKAIDKLHEDLQYDYLQVWESLK
ncbi:MAG: hypothetical protein ACWA5P_12455 [bacterium]